MALAPRSLHTLAPLSSPKKPGLHGSVGHRCVTRGRRVVALGQRPTASAVIQPAARGRQRSASCFSPIHYSSCDNGMMFLSANCWIHFFFFCEIKHITVFQSSCSALTKLRFYFEGLLYFGFVTKKPNQKVLIPVSTTFLQKTKQINNKIKHKH